MAAEKTNIDLLEVDRVLLKFIERNPGIEFFTIVDRVKRRWKKVWISRRLILLQDIGLIVRTKNGASRPTRMWLPDHPEIPWDQVIRR